MTSTDLKWIAVDLDGTLAESLWTPDNPTSEIGSPIPGNIKKAQEVCEAGYKLIVHTARPSTDYRIIEDWLTEQEVPFKFIQTGKILAAAYVDDRAIHADQESWIPVPAGSYPQYFAINAGWEADINLRKETASANVDVLASDNFWFPTTYQNISDVAKVWGPARRVC